MSTKKTKLISFESIAAQNGITDCRTTIDRKMKADPPQFPLRVRTAKSRIAWRDDEIDAHVARLERGNAVNFRAKAGKAAQDD